MTHLPETALHRIWERHDLLTLPLRTADGRAVRVVHAGTPNPDSGPDFLGAVIRIGATTFRGDVEIHTTPSHWHVHGHDRDPRYNRVILHVTGCTGGSATPPARTCSGRLLPHLILPPSYRVPVTSPTARERIIETCAGRIRTAPDPRCFLRRLGWARILRRTGQFEQRLAQLSVREPGTLAEPEIRYALPHRPKRSRPRSHRILPTPEQWEQVVYEALMESMGYARNGAAFLLLARTVPLSDLHRGNLRNTERSMGILFGAAGLLPDPAALPDDEAAAFVRVLHGHWRTWRMACARSAAPEMSWVFFRLRPANFPTARIAGAAYLLPILFSRHRLLTLLRMVADRRTPEGHAIRLAHQAMTFTPQGFWSSHLHFHDRKKARGVGLGRDRMAVIVLNALLPAALLHARTTGDRALARRLRRSACHVTTSHEPRIVRDIMERTPNLVGRMGGVEQMGMLELVRRAQTWTRIV